MPVTIQLSDSLASRLRNQAPVRNANLDEYAQTLLESLVNNLEAKERWRLQNERRLALIAKSFNGGITAEEERELEQLQQAVDLQLEAGDRHLLAFVSRLEETSAKTSKE